MKNKKLILIIILTIIILLGGVYFIYTSLIPKELYEKVEKLDIKDVKDKKIAYITGKNPNNYIWYNGFMWRIMAIEKNKNIHIIMENNLLNMSYNQSETLTSDLYLNSDIRTLLNEKFYNNLNESKKEIIYNDFTFCTTYMESMTKKCLTNISDRVRMLSMREYTFVKGKDSYLNNGLTFWTINNNTNHVNNAIAINNNGTIVNSDVKDNLGIRPVIVIKGNSIVKEGKGSIEKPYLLQNDKLDNSNLKLKTITIGNYIKYSDKLFKIVQNDTIGTKVVLSSNNKKIDKIKFDSKDNELLIEPNNINNIGYYLKNKININHKNIIKDILWNYNNVMTFGILNNHDLLSGQDSDFKITYWIINSEDLKNAYAIDKNGYMHKTARVIENKLLYSFYLKNDLVIKCGNGTVNNPYIIK